MEEFDNIFEPAENAQQISAENTHICNIGDLCAYLKAHNIKYHTSENHGRTTDVWTIDGKGGQHFRSVGARIVIIDENGNERDASEALQDKIIPRYERTRSDVDKINEALQFFNARQDHDINDFPNCISAISRTAYDVFSAKLNEYETLPAEVAREAATAHAVLKMREECKTFSQQRTFDIADYVVSVLDVEKNKINSVQNEQYDNETICSIDGAPFISLHNISIISGDAGAMKTTTIATILQKLFIDKLNIYNNGQINQQYTIDDQIRITATDVNVEKVVWLDTEQSNFDSMRTYNKLVAYDGRISPYIEYKTIRQLSTPNRFIKFFSDLLQSKEKTIFVLDGVTDIVDAVMDDTESGIFTRLLLRVLDVKDISVICVIHTNQGDIGGKSRGHIGADLWRKTIAQLQLTKIGSSGPGEAAADIKFKKLRRDNLQDAKITALFDKINKHTSVRLTWEAESSIDVGHIERIIQAAKPINANGCSLGFFVTAKNIQDIVGKGKSAKIRDQMIKDGYIVEVNEMQTRGAAFDAGILQSISNASKLYKINENRIQTTDDDDFVF